MTLEDAIKEALDSMRDAMRDLPFDHCVDTLARVLSDRSQEYPLRVIRHAMVEVDH